MLVSRASDGNYYKLCDREEKSGYAPSIRGLCESDGCNMVVCLECGWIQGFEKCKSNSRGRV
jgi:hypothetical protein